MPSTRMLARCLAPLALAAAPWPQPLQAQVQRCVSPAGEPVYTDRKCSEIGANERLASPSGHPLTAYRGGCSRRLRDVVYGVTSAIEARDVNRLALLYDWAGMSTRQGYAVMTRLDGIVNRPLVDILPVYADPPPVTGADGTVVDRNADGYFPQTTVRRAPVGLRLEQTFSNGVTPARTTFGLRKRLGCWWLSL